MNLMCVSFLHIYLLIRFLIQSLLLEYLLYKIRWQDTYVRKKFSQLNYIIQWRSIYLKRILLYNKHLSNCFLAKRTFQF